MLSSQEVFDKVVLHLRIQNKKSLSDDGICMYRGENGYQCAIGCLISDKDYSPYWENHSLNNLLDNCSLPASLKQFFLHHKDLLLRLQEIHDCFRVELWEKNSGNWQLCAV